MSRDITPEDRVRGRALGLARERPYLVVVAPDLLELIRQIAEDDYKPHILRQQARALLAKATGKETA